MKLKCLAYNLKEGIALTEKISGKNNTLPILNSILFSSKNKGLKISSTNLEIGLEIKISAKIEEEGEIAIPAKLIYGFLSNLPSEENIELESNQNNLFIITKNSKTIIKGYPIEDFPIIPSFKEKKDSFEIPVKDFIMGLNFVYYAAYSSEMKPEIASIFINSQKNIPLTFVATDSFRLAKKNIPYNFNNFPSILIPVKSATEIIRIFENENGNIKIIPNKNQLFIFSERINFVCRLTEGIFPDYEEIIPKTFLTNIYLDKTSLNNALKTAGVFSGRLNEVRIEIIPNQKEIKIETHNSDFGEHTTILQAEIKGEKIKTTFNHKYLNDGLKFISSDKVLLRFNGENKPLFISDAKDNSFYYLVMPMKDI